MGFIDYHGTKEDIYDEVVGYADVVQEVEYRHREDERVSQWLDERMPDKGYGTLSEKELLKHIISRYHGIADIESKLTGDTEEGLPNASIMWSDFFIYVMYSHLSPFELLREEEEKYYSIFLKKVFKRERFTSLEEHTKALEHNEIYRQYFQDCFDILREKQFWRWFGKLSRKNPGERATFIDKYEELSVLLGFYFYTVLSPTTDEWLQRIDVERNALERIRSEYRRNRYSEPDISKICNPLVLPGCVKNDSLKSNKRTSSRLNKSKLDELLEKKTVSSFLDASGLIRACELPISMDELFGNVEDRLSVLADTVEKYKGIYNPELFEFYEYYVPEIMQLTATFIEYEDAGIGPDLLRETGEEILDAGKDLLIAINDKIDEIYRFVSIDTKARAKALDSIMAQNGHVESKYKID